MTDKGTFSFAEIKSRFPGLLEKVHQVFRDTENAYEDSDTQESFLWEHTMHVASIANRLAQAEGMDPMIPVVAALFHDAGKFAEGHYHSDGTIEEEESARIAEPLLRQFGMKASDIRKVLSGVQALYNEKSRKNRVGAILHDADFLSKFGAMGVASFFYQSHTARPYAPIGSHRLSEQRIDLCGMPSSEHAYGCREKAGDPEGQGFGKIFPFSP